jgi:hypothetical protein
LKCRRLPGRSSQSMRGCSAENFMRIPGENSGFKQVFQNVTIGNNYPFQIEMQIFPP